MSHNIDHIFYINLAHRTDRRAEIENELNLFGLSYERFDAVSTPGCGSIGCSYSHLGALKLAKERGYKNVLIFEDDFRFTITKDEFEERIARLFDSKIEFDVCMLGYKLLRGGDTVGDLTRAYDAQNMSGYLVNQCIYDTLIGLYEWSSPLMKSTKQHWKYACDQAWKPLQSKHYWYCFTPKMGNQRPSYSDNTERFENYADL
jgi:glycosyl transferase family 25